MEYSSNRKEKKEKFKKPEWIVEWQGLLPGAPRNMSRKGEWVYWDRKVARRDAFYYSQFYKHVSGPFIYAEKKHRDRDDDVRNRRRSRSVY